MYTVLQDVTSCALQQAVPQHIQICHTLHEADPNGNYKVKDPEKLIRIAKEWGVETEGKDIYDLAHEMSELALLEYGKPFGTQRFLKRAPQHTQDIWEREEKCWKTVEKYDKTVDRKTYS